MEDCVRVGNGTFHAVCLLVDLDDWRARAWKH